MARELGRPVTLDEVRPAACERSPRCSSSTSTSFRATSRASGPSRCTPSSPHAELTPRRTPCGAADRQPRCWGRSARGRSAWRPCRPWSGRLGGGLRLRSGRDVSEGADAATRGTVAAEARRAGAGALLPSRSRQRTAAGWETRTLTSRARHGEVNAVRVSGHDRQTRAGREVRSPDRTNSVRTEAGGERTQRWRCGSVPASCSAETAPATTASVAQNLRIPPYGPLSVCKAKSRRRFYGRSEPRQRARNGLRPLRRSCRRRSPRGPSHRRARRLLLGGAALGPRRGPA